LVFPLLRVSFPYARDQKQAMNTPLFSGRKGKGDRSICQ